LIKAAEAIFVENNILAERLCDPGSFLVWNGGGYIRRYADNSIWSTNLSLEKSFRLGERYSLYVAAQATNLFNNVQFRPGINTSFGATVLPATIASNPTLNLKVGQLLDTANTWGPILRTHTTRVKSNSS
jgi:hypothetical protein